MTNGLRVNNNAPVGERPSDIIRGRTGVAVAGVSSVLGSAISGTPADGDLIYYDAATDTWLLATIGTLTAAGLNVISPAQLTATTNNWNPTGMATADIVRVSTDASRNLTGIRDPTPISQRLMLENIGAFDLVLVHDGSTSGGGNRFVCPNDVDYTVPPDSAVWLNYDVTTGRWRVIEAPAGSTNAQMLPDNDANFTSTIGNWTASAGTLVRDATAALSPLSASMLFTPGASGKHIDLPIAGTFLAGVPYVAVLIVRQGTGADTFRGNFGLIGTDATQWGDWALITDGGYAISMRWTPTATRTGVSIRWTNLGSGTVRVYAARLYQAAEPPIIQIGYRQFLTSAASSVTPWLQFGTNDGGNLVLSPGQATLQGSPYNGVAVKAHDNGSGADSQLSMWAEHNAADFADYGVNIETGVDYVGLYISEKDAGTVQIYADTSGGYDIELKDRGSGFWKAVSASYSTPLAGIPHLYRLAFAWNTVSIATGVTVGAVKAGDVILGAWIDVATAWNSTVSDLGDIVTTTTAESLMGATVNMQSVAGGTDRRMLKDGAVFSGVQSIMRTDQTIKVKVASTGISLSAGAGTAYVLVVPAANA